MQLGHSHRQLLSRCTLRSYSVRKVPANKISDATATSGTPAPSRLKRPLVSTFGGIDIQNVVVPTKSTSQRSHIKSTMPSRSHGSSDQSPDARRPGHLERNRRMPRDGASDWGDGLVSLSFTNRLRLHQKRSTTRDAVAGLLPPEAQSWNRKSNQGQRTQTQGVRRRQEQDDNASQNNRQSGETETRRSSFTSVQQEHRSSARITGAQNNKPEASMTRLSSFKRYPQSTKTPTPSNAATSRADPTAAHSFSNATINQSATSSSNRKARLAVLASTNLNALFRTDTPTAGTSLPSLASSTTDATATARSRVRGALERSAGDYSRFLPRHVGVRKSALRVPALRTARHALGTQRDVSLEKRRVALHIIGGLVQPRREVRA